MPSSRHPIRSRRSVISAAIVRISQAKQKNAGGLTLTSKESSLFELWFWSGKPEAAARRVSIPGLSGLEHAEGVCPAIIDGQSKIVIVSDDGDRARGRFSQFLMLDPGQIEIAAA